MTNYEWLVKTGKLAEFIFDVQYDYAKEENETDVLYNKYDLLIKWGDSKSEIIAEWLKAKRISKIYVLFDDVINALLESQIKISTDEHNGYAVKYAREFLQDIAQKLRLLPKKEIDE